MNEVIFGDVQNYLQIKRKMPKRGNTLNTKSRMALNLKNWEWSPAIDKFENLNLTFNQRSPCDWPQLFCFIVEIFLLDGLQLAFWMSSYQM